MFARLRNDLGPVLAAAKPGRRLYHDAQYLTAVVAVDAKAMARWLPFGIRLAQPARADLFCAYFPENVYTGAYHEAGLFVHVKVGRGYGIFCPWMIVDDDRALILGRELLGYPKKLGSFDWNHEGGRIQATARRRGTTLVEMDAKLGEAVEGAPPILGLPHRNVLGNLLGLPRQIRFTPREEPIEVRRVDLQLRFEGTPEDPLRDMGLGAVTEARLHRVDLFAGVLPPVPIPRPISPLYLARHLIPRVL